MAGNGRISVLVEPKLQILLSAVREMPRDVAARIRKETKEVVKVMWQEEVRGNVSTRLESRVLLSSATVAVSDINVTLKAGGVGKLSSGTPRSAIATAVEFGADPRFARTVTSSTGRAYKRRTKAQFRLPRSRGYVFWPAARAVIPRAASLWIQTAYRTAAESLEKGGARLG
jgi:hypothetical protein